MKSDGNANGIIHILPIEESQISSIVVASYQSIILKNSSFNHYNVYTFYPMVLNSIYSFILISDKLGNSLRLIFLVIRVVHLIENKNIYV
jgi:hypothetical protein